MQVAMCLAKILLLPSVVTRWILLTSLSAIAVSRQTELSGAMKDQLIVIIVAIVVVLRVAAAARGSSISGIGSGSTRISSFA
jgi:hypothetical protein